MKVIYEKHPVTKERKAYLRGKGYRILDAVFAPADYKNPEPKSEEEAETKAEKEAEVEVVADTEVKTEEAATKTAPAKKVATKTAAKE